MLMFLVVVAYVLLVYGHVLWRREARRAGSAVSTDYYGGGLRASGYAMLFVWAVMTSIAVIYAVSSAASISYRESRVRIMTERYEEQAAVVSAELDRYPEYERALLTEMKPHLLLAYPTIRSSETMTKKVSELVRLKDGIYMERMLLEESWRNLEIAHRLIWPWWGVD